jgi:hypothetical protein
LVILIKGRSRDLEQETLFAGAARSSAPTTMRERLAVHPKMRTRNVAGRPLPARHNWK